MCIHQHVYPCVDRCEQVVQRRTARWLAARYGECSCTSRARRASSAGSTRACRSTGSKGPSPPASPFARSTRCSARSASCRASATSSALPPSRRPLQPQPSRPRCRHRHLQRHRQLHRLHRDASDTRLVQWPEVQRDRECDSADARWYCTTWYLAFALLRERFHSSHQWRRAPAPDVLHENYSFAHSRSLIIRALI